MIQTANDIFVLHTEHTTYAFRKLPTGQLEHLYYGRKIHVCEPLDENAVAPLIEKHTFQPGNSCVYDREHDAYTLEDVCLEMSAYGKGDIREPFVELIYEDGSFSSDFVYESSVRFEGREARDAEDALPASYDEKNQVEHLCVTLKDNNSALKLELHYYIYEDCDVITRSAKVINTEEDKIRLTKAQAACIDFVHGEFDIISFYGRHAMERNMQRTPAGHGAFVIGSRRGTSSHQYNPMMILAEKETTEDAGTCYGMSFVYSGGFKAEVEKDQFGQTRMQMGLQEEQFSYPLEKGEEFVIPEVMLTCSSQGLGKLSQNLQRCIRKNLCRGKYKEKVRPVLINSWEACYFDFTGEDIYHLAEQAKDLGIDMVVLDDGWFGSRNDDNSGLGDWKVNEEKLQGSLGDLISRINALGVKFGLWFEPEMVNEDSDLYREHPDWAIQIPGRKPVKGRNQLILDFSRKEVVNAVYEQMCQVLDQGNIEYVKWDMNRSMAEVYSMTAEEQGSVQYDYMLGLYDFLERIISRYPDLLIEGCSGGGGRFDAGMLYYTPQIWCSDNTDAVDRVRIQYGTSFGYPVSAVGSHVSAVPNHQTGRKTSLHTRGVCAMAGTFGYELDPAKMTDEERREIREQIVEYKKYAQLVQNGLYYRLSNPFAEEIGAWEFVSEDGKEVLVNVVMLEIHGNMTVNYVKMKGLRAGQFYKDSRTGKIYPAEALMEVGIPMPLEFGEYKAYQIYLEMVE